MLGRRMTAGLIQIQMVLPTHQRNHGRSL